MSTYANSEDIHLSCKMIKNKNESDNDTYLVTLDKSEGSATLSQGNTNIPDTIEGWSDSNYEFKEKIIDDRTRHDVYKISTYGSWTFYLDRDSLKLKKEYEYRDSRYAKYQCNIVTQRELKERYDELVERVKRNIDAIESKRKI